MQTREPDATQRSERAQSLCREVGDLVELSREQRRGIDALLTQLERVMRTARRYRLTRGAAGPMGSSRG
jgi:hypothetical protein